MWTTLPWELELWQLLLGAALVLLIYLLYVRKYGKYSNLPPRVPGLPFFGNAFQIRGPEYLHLHLTEFGKTHGDLFTVTLFGQHFVSINSGELLSNMMSGDFFPTKNAKSYVNKRLRYECDGVGLCETSYKQRQLRMTVMRALSACESQETLLEGEALKLVKNLLKHERKSVPVSHEVKKSIASVLTVSLLGKQYNEKDLEEMLAFGDMLDVIISPGFGAELDYIPFLRWFPVRSIKYIQAAETLRSKYVDQEFEKAKASFDPEKVQCMVHRLIELMQRKRSVIPDITDRTIKGVMLDMYAAGWSTTSALLNAFILTLLHKPEEQQRLQEEVDSVVGPSKVPNVRDRDKMPYFQAFIAEGLRLFSVGTVGKRSAGRDVQYHGYYIPKGTNVLYNVWAANHDCEIFDEPWSFKADRYLDDEGRLLRPSHLIWKRSLPFGEGKRSCLGQAFARDRLFIYMATLMQRLSFSPPEGAPLPSYDPRTFEPALVVCPHPFMAIVIPRG